MEFYEITTDDIEDMAERVGERMYQAERVFLTAIYDVHGALKSEADKDLLRSICFYNSHAKELQRCAEYLYQQKKGTTGAPSGPVPPKAIPKAHAAGKPEGDMEEAGAEEPLDLLTEMEALEQVVEGRIAEERKYLASLDEDRKRLRGSILKMKMSMEAPDAEADHSTMFKVNCTAVCPKCGFRSLFTRCPICGTEAISHDPDAEAPVVPTEESDDRG